MSLCMYVRADEPVHAHMAGRPPRAIRVWYIKGMHFRHPDEPHMRKAAYLKYHQDHLYTCYKR